jgi:hypothetical protein
MKVLGEAQWLRVLALVPDVCVAQHCVLCHGGWIGSLCLVALHATPNLLVPLKEYHSCATSASARQLIPLSACRPHEVNVAACEIHPNFGN